MTFATSIETTTRTAFDLASTPVKLATCPTAVELYLTARAAARQVCHYTGSIISALTSARAARFYGAVGRGVWQTVCGTWQVVCITAALVFTTGRWGLEAIDRFVQSCEASEQVELRHPVDVAVDAIEVVADAVVRGVRAVVLDSVTVWAIEIARVVAGDAVAAARYGLR